MINVVSIWYLATQTLLLFSHCRTCNNIQSLPISPPKLLIINIFFAVVLHLKQTRVWFVIYIEH